jgi:hypothetical protein
MVLRVGNIASRRRRPGGEGSGGSILWSCVRPPRAHRRRRSLVCWRIRRDRSEHGCDQSRSKRDSMYIELWGVGKWRKGSYGRDAIVVQILQHLIHYGGCELLVVFDDSECHGGRIEVKHRHFTYVCLSEDCETSRGLGAYPGRNSKCVGDSPTPLTS